MSPNSLSLDSLSHDPPPLTVIICILVFCLTTALCRMNCRAIDSPGYIRTWGDRITMVSVSPQGNWLTGVSDPSDSESCFGRSVVRLPAFIPGLIQDWLTGVSDPIQWQWVMFWRICGQTPSFYTRPNSGLTHWGIRPHPVTVSHVLADLWSAGLVPNFGYTFVTVTSVLLGLNIFFFYQQDHCTLLNNWIYLRYIFRWRFLLRFNLHYKPCFF